MAHARAVVYLVAVNALRWTGPMAGLVALMGVVACDQTTQPSARTAPVDVESQRESSPVAVLHPRPVARVRTKPQPAGPLNVIMITVDALRSDMPWNGYKRDIAPNLTRFAKRSVRFSNHRANTSFTAQSVPTLLTGRLASSLYRSGYFFAAYAPANRFITEDLSAAGVRTIGLHAHMYFNRGKGLDQGFSTWETVKGISYNEKTDEHVTSEKLTDRLIAVLSEQKQAKKSFFAWTHYMDPHHVYTKHKESPNFGDKPRDVYDNEVHFTDRHLGRLFAFVEKQPWAERTAVIVTADHGEAFGEHGMNQHAHELWDVLVKVPMLVKIPGGQPSVVAAATSHLDIAPTILELMGRPRGEAMQGASLVPRLHGDAPQPQRSERVIPLELAADNIQPARRAVVVGDYKLIRYGAGKGYKHQLFNLKVDPGEKSDLSKSEPQTLAKMQASLDQTFDRIESIAPYGGMKLKGGGRANGTKGPTVAAR